MSNPLIKHKTTFADVKATLTSNVASTSADTLAEKTTYIDDASILKRGDVQVNVLPDLDRFLDAIEHDIDTTATANELHFIDTAKQVFTRIKNDIRVLLLENQQWFVKNESNTIRYVVRSHIGPNGDQIMRSVKKLAPGETGILHG